MTSRVRPRPIFCLALFATLFLQWSLQVGAQSVASTMLAPPMSLTERLDRLSEEIEHNRIDRRVPGVAIAIVCGKEAITLVFEESPRGVVTAMNFHRPGALPVMRSTTVLLGHPAVLLGDASAAELTQTGEQWTWHSGAALWVIFPLRP